MGLGIIVPGYLKIRAFELQEAKSYTLDRNKRMLEIIEQRIQVLNKAGVSDIPSYIQQSKDDILRDFEAMEPDPRVVRLIMDANGVRLFDGTGDVSLEIQASLLTQINRFEDVYFHYKAPDQAWLTMVEKQDEWGWTILSMMPEREVYSESQQYLLYVLAVSVLVMLLVLSLSILLTRQLRLRAGSILELLKRYGDGDYEERLQVTGPAELGDLQLGINTMIDNIEMEILSRKSIEDELNSARLQAEEVNLAKAEYARDMNHQVQNAMNSASGFSQLLLKSNLDEKQQRYISNVLAANQLLNTLVSDMLALSGIEFNQQTYEEEEESGAMDGKEAETIRSYQGAEDILLVGVDALNCAYLTEIMSRYGVTPSAVHDETAAISYLEEKDVDLIVLDIDCSKLGAEESIAYLRSNMSAYTRSIPVLLMTSTADSQLLARYRRLGISQSIRKPFSATGLLNVMSEIFQV